jgi:hypothetical protein
MRCARCFVVVVVVVVVVAASGCVEGADGAAPRGVRDLRINEVAARGVPFDWFELVNVGDEEVSLDDVTFSDDAAVVDKGSFAKGASVAPGEFVVVEVDDAGVGFKLGSDEEVHVYARDNGAVVDEVDWDEGAAPDGGSFARVPDGDGDFVTVTPDTRGRSNDG